MDTLVPCLFLLSCSNFLVSADPVGLALVIPDCHQNQEIVPLKTYFGGQEGVGKYTWHRTKTKPNGLDLIDISSSSEDVVMCGQTL